MKLQNGSIGLLLGLVLGATTALVLSFQFTRSAVLTENQRHNDRQAIVAAGAFATLVEAGTDDAALATATENFVRGAGETVVEARVLRLSGARLVASTREGDTAGARLPREEKPFFDLAKELKAGMATNRDEGVFRKREIAVEPDPDVAGLRVVTAPYFGTDGDFDGVVQLKVQPAATAEAPTASIPWAVAAVWLLLGLPLCFWAPDSRRLRLGALLLVLPLAGGLVMVNNGHVASLFGARAATEARLAQHAGRIRTAAQVVADAQGFDASALAARDWDTDTYRRPLGFRDAAGVPRHEAVNADLAAFVTPLRKSLMGNTVLGVLVYLFFALGLAGRVWRTLVTHRGAYGYVAPGMIGMLVLVFFPFLYGVALSFTDQTLYNTDKPLTEILVGFDNYVDILTDWHVLTRTGEGLVINYQNFYWTAFITICWTFCNVTIGVTVGLALALCLNTQGFGVFHLPLFGKLRTLDIKPLYRAVLVLPWALPTYVTALIWKGLFHKQFGPINQIIQMFGGEAVSWFDSVFTSFLTGIVVNGWLSFPFMMLISLGGLQSISADMYEAARLDGASRVQQFRYITLPSLRPTLIPAIIISVVWTFNLFNVIYLVSGGEPAGANEILVTQAYKIAFEKYQYGYAAAYSVVIFIILLTYGVFQNKMSKATEDIRA